VNGENVKAILARHVETDATLMMGSYPLYRQPGQAFAAHHTVDHGAGEYACTVAASEASGEGETATRAHINTAEGFFSQLKRV